MGHRRAIKEIRHLEADIKKWQVLVDKVRGDNSPDFDNQTLAVLRGRLVRYLMRSKEVSIKIEHYTKYFSVKIWCPFTFWPKLHCGVCRF